MENDKETSANSVDISIDNTPKEKRVLRKKEDLKKFFYPHDIQKILAVANERQAYNILVLLNTGARINEARNITRQDLDMMRNNITLRVTKVRAELGEKKPDPRTIPVSTKFFRYLKKNVENHQELFYTTSAFRKMLQSLCKQANVKDVKEYSPHNIRKTFGTWMLSLGVDGFKLAQHLGHSPEMLRTHYASPDIFIQEDKDRMRELLDDLPSRMRYTN